MGKWNGKQKVVRAKKTSIKKYKPYVGKGQGTNKAPSKKLKKIKQKLIESDEGEKVILRKLTLQEKQAYHYDRIMKHHDKVDSKSTQRKQGESFRKFEHRLQKDQSRTFAQSKKQQTRRSEKFLAYKKRKQDQKSKKQIVEKFDEREEYYFGKRLSTGLRDTVDAPLFHDDMKELRLR
ncbi:hypothetical protein ADUPG1_009284 [Aduncisulcus paluster]|uniref:Uncharacterized protein n=1 Tax=Aduncisulcus paluster TaxID=2918883 RepID=A0ABQ5KV36_9EUKA|nr:hypothetical protein ADUPG1_009284 [Aduncisulcus paluster]